MNGASDSLIFRRAVLGLEPFDAIDLRHVDELPRPRRPFDRDRVADRGDRVEVALGGPGDHDLARLLPDLAERQARRGGAG